MSAPDDVALWLDRLGLAEYAPLFAAQVIDRTVLADLNEQDLKDLGIPLGHRKRLLKAIAALAEPSPAPPESPARSEAERRQLTVLFCDLVGSTALSARLDPEDMGALMRDYQGCCAEAVKRWDGHVAKYLGDGVRAYFGWPQAHEDDAERAVRAGLDLVAAVARLSAGEGTPLAARVGIATGPVVVGELIGEGVAQEEAVVGETPNLAARLQALAEPGGVVISQATRRLVGRLFELTDLGPLRLKGFAEPLAAFRVAGEGRAEGRFEALHGQRLTPLVGREHELGILLERWARAKDGEGQLVLIAGEPGIGKSRLLRALRAELSDEPHVVLSHFCSPYHTNSALYPIIAQLERAASLVPDDALETRFSKLEGLLRQAGEQLDEALPLLAALLGIPAGERYPAPNLSPQRRKRRTLEVLLEQLAGLARVRPVLELYEDLHWVDPSTIELLDLLVERLRSLPVLAVLTYRPEFSPPWSGRAHVTALPLNRLGRRQGAAIAERIAGGKALPAEVLDQIVARTDGVPLFVEELTNTVLESGLLTDAGDHYELAGPLPPLAIPATLHDSLMARLDRLAPVKEVAQTAAVIGREFSHALVAAVSPLPENKLGEALDQLVSSELVFRRGTAPDATYSFKHALVQDAAYQSLLRSKRQQLHARIAAVLEARGEKTQREPELLAHHYRKAGLLEDAIPYAIRAGDLAFGRFAFVEARARYQDAMDMSQALPSSEQASPSQIRILLKLAHTYQLLGEFGYMPATEAYPKAKSAALKALELDPTSAQAHYIMAIIHGLYDWDWTHSELAYKTALELDPDHLRAHHDYGILLLTPLGRHDEAISELERALELDPSISWTGVDLASALNHARRPDRAKALLSKVFERDPTFEDHRQLGFAHIQLGDYEAGLAEFEKTVELMGGAEFALAQLGWAYGMAGQKQEAQTILNELSSRSRREHVDPLALAWLHIALGNKEAAFSWLERACEARSSWLIFLKVHQLYDSLRSDPRYQDLLRRLGLES